MPVKTPWGDASTVFDETLALSTAWVERLPSGLVVGSGDVILTFDADSVDWTRPGVCGVAMLQPAEMGTRHGVYVTDEQGRVYAFLQKPSVSELQAAGGLLPGDQVALDIGLLRFSPEAAARLSQLAGVSETEGKLSLGNSILDDSSPIGLVRARYHGAHRPVEAGTRATPPALHALADALKGLPFWCSTVSGDFTHIGTTTLFRELMTEETEFSRLYAVQQRLGATRQPGLRSAGVVIDSVLSGGGDLGSATVVIECNLLTAVRAASGSVLHGLDGIPGPVEVPEDTVVHQVPVSTPEGRRGVVIRVYGVEDDPKASVASWNATWFGRPMLEELRSLGMDSGAGVARSAGPRMDLVECPPLPGRYGRRSLGLRAVAAACLGRLLRRAVERAGAAIAGLERPVGGQRGTRSRTFAAVKSALAHTWPSRWPRPAPTSGRCWRMRRESDRWRKPAMPCVPRLRNWRPRLPPRRPAATTPRAFSSDKPASRRRPARAHAAAFHLVERAVKAGSYGQEQLRTAPWQHAEVTVEGPARIDLGGGWSDTPPFCLDWGGTVLNIGVLLNGCYPIRTTIRRLQRTGRAV